jgi:predicted short-subunit dehydrogenase-like oxidoreductase (DUF2520 family)
MPANQKIRKKTRYNFAIIGAGMVGTAIGVLLKKAGNNIICVCDKSPASLKRAAKYIKADAFKKSLDKVGRADCLLITTSDDAISSACREISRLPDIKGKFVFHMSGAGGLNLLDTAAATGAFVGSIHPLQSFSSIENAMANIPDSYFGITANGKTIRTAKNIVAGLKGIPLFISDEQKPLYHAAACFASNYLVVLLHAVESLYQATGIKEKQARQAYLPLVYGTLKNIQRSGPVRALTGPIARGDTGTIKNHMETIKTNAPLFAPLYSALGMITTKMARQKGTISPSRVKLITDILKGVKK